MYRATNLFSQAAGQRERSADELAQELRANPATKQAGPLPARRRLRENKRRLGSGFSKCARHLTTSILVRVSQKGARRCSDCSNIIALPLPTMMRTR
jgi:hypothetical protein